MPSTLDFPHDLAQQMRTSGQTRTWRKVTTLLSAYDAYRLTAGVRDRIGRDFEAAGLQLSPPIHEASRDASVRISLAEATLKPSIGPAKRDLPSSVSFWVPSDSGWTSVTSPMVSTGVVLIDIDLSLHESHDELIELLPSYAPGLTTAAVKDLLDPDHEAAFKTRDVDHPAKSASLFTAATEDSEAMSGDKAVPLSLGLIEFAVGDTWLVTARHPPTSYSSGSPADSGQTPPTAEHYMESLRDYGLRATSTSEEAALAVVNQGVDSFRRARAVFASYLETWRTDFARGLRDKSLLTGLQATLPLTVDALEPLRRPTVTDWMQGGPQGRSRELSDQVERNYDALQDLQGTVAAAVGQADQAKNEEYQRSLATLAAVLLAPALVASVFGANNVLEDSPLDLVWLLLAMIAAGALTQFFIVRRFGRRKAKPEPRKLAETRGPAGAAKTHPLSADRSGGSRIALDRRPSDRVLS